MHTSVTRQESAERAHTALSHPARSTHAPSRLLVAVPAGDGSTAPAPLLLLLLLLPPLVLLLLAPPGTLAATSNARRISSRDDVTVTLGSAAASVARLLGGGGSSGTKSGQISSCTDRPAFCKHGADVGAQCVAGCWRRARCTQHVGSTLLLARSSLLAQLHAGVPLARAPARPRVLALKMKVTRYSRPTMMVRTVMAMRSAWRRGWCAVQHMPAPVPAAAAAAETSGRAHATASGSARRNATRARLGALAGARAGAMARPSAGPCFSSLCSRLAVPGV